MPKLIKRGKYPCKRVTPITHADLWQSCLLQMIEPQEGDVVLDYGCGYAQLANTLSGLLDDFAYYGFDLNNEHGRNVVARARREIGHDPRVLLGNLEDDDDLLSAAFSTCNYVVLGSVLTHLTEVDSVRLLRRICTRVKHQGARIFFTASVGVAERGRHGTYGVPSCFSFITHDEESFFGRVKKLGKLTENKEIDYTFKGYRHRFFTLVARKGI